MPLYEYECQKCGSHSERIEKLSGPHLRKCPKCGGRVERLMSAPAIRFKGSGWYVNDYARSSPGNTPSKEDGASQKADTKEGKADKAEKADKSDGKPAPAPGEKKKPAGKEK